MNIEEFEKIMQRDDKEEKVSQKKYGMIKVNGFLKEQRKNKKIFQIDLFLKQ